MFDWVMVFSVCGGIILSKVFDVVIDLIKYRIKKGIWKNYNFKD